MKKLQSIIGQASELNTEELGQLLPLIGELLNRKIKNKSRLRYTLNMARKDLHPITKI